MIITREKRNDSAHMCLDGSTGIGSWHSALHCDWHLWGQWVAREAICIFVTRSFGRTTKGTLRSHSKSCADWCVALHLLRYHNASTIQNTRRMQVLYSYYMYNMDTYKLANLLYPFLSPTTFAHTVVRTKYIQILSWRQSEYHSHVMYTIHNAARHSM